MLQCAGRSRGQDPWRAPHITGTGWKRAGQRTRESHPTVHRNMHMTCDAPPSAILSLINQAEDPRTSLPITLPEEGSAHTPSPCNWVYSSAGTSPSLPQRFYHQVHRYLLSVCACFHAGCTNIKGPHERLKYNEQTISSRMASRTHTPCYRCEQENV